ncbi:MAG: NAD-glutamate dehydrogenase [Proteobacteria bacterium]|nr:NAD-glutamate dehydrogenase [Pseudomonadota bacterium]
MGKISVDTKVDFQRQLERRIQKIEKGDSLRQFASQFFSQVPLAEVKTKTWEYVESVLLSAWSFYKSFDGNTPRVRAFNPTEKTHGYLHAQTIVEVASRNLPFLLDSIRIELSSRGIALVDVEQCMLNVVRASSNKIVINDGEHANESLIHLEVDRLANRKELEKSMTGCHSPGATGRR